MIGTPRFNWTWMLVIALRKTSLTAGNSCNVSVTNFGNNTENRDNQRNEVFLTLRIWVQRLSKA